MCVMRCIKSNQFTQIASSSTKWETGTTLQIVRNLLVNKSGTEWYHDVIYRLYCGNANKLQTLWLL